MLGLHQLVHTRTYTPRLDQQPLLILKYLYRKLSTLRKKYPHALHALHARGCTSSWSRCPQVRQTQAMPAKMQVRPSSPRPCEKLACIRPEYVSGMLVDMESCKEQ